MFPDSRRRCADASGIPDVDAANVLAINLNTTILINQRVARHMMERKSGRIINISSVDSEIVAKGGERAVYSTAKAGESSQTASTRLLLGCVPHTPMVAC